MSEPETPANSDEALEKALQSTIDSLRQEFEGRLAEARAELEGLIEELREAEARRRQEEAAAAAVVSEAAAPARPDELLQALAALDAGATQEEILRALIAGAVRFADRAALFLTTAEGLSLWASHGFADPPDEPLELAWKSGPWTELSAGRGAVRLGADDCEPIVDGLAGERPSRGVAVPLVLRDRIAAALYADREGGGEPLLPALQILAYSTALAVEALPLRRRRTTPSLQIANGEPGPGLPLWDPEWAGVEARGGGESTEGPAEEEPAASSGDEPVDLAVTQEVDLASLPDADWGDADWGNGDWVGTGSAAAALDEPLAKGEGAEPAETLAAEGLGLEMEDTARADELADGEELLDGEDRDADDAWVPVGRLTGDSEDGAPPTLQPWGGPSGEGEIQEEVEIAPGDDLGAAVEVDALIDQPVEEAIEVPIEEASELPVGVPVGERLTGEAGVTPVEVSDLGAEETAPPATPAAGGGQEEDESASPELGLQAEVAPPEALEGPGSAFATPPLAASEDEADLHEDARRLARLLVSELMLYNESEITRGRRQGNVYAQLADEIDRSREVYEQRIDDRIRRATDYFREELVRVLAGGDPGILGA